MAPAGWVWKAEKTSNDNTYWPRLLIEHDDVNDELVSSELSVDEAAADAPIHEDTYCHGMHKSPRGIRNSRFLNGASFLKLKAAAKRNFLFKKIHVYVLAS